MAEIWWAAAAFFPLAVISAVVPWVNAELLMLSGLPLARTHEALGLLVAVVTAGQMTGKGIMFWLARLARGRRAGRVPALAEPWISRLEQRPESALGLVLFSSLVGFPPFYFVSMAAGAVGMRFGRFLTVGTLGRLIHFGAIAFVPHLVSAKRVGL